MRRIEDIVAMLCIVFTIPMSVGMFLLLESLAGSLSYNPDTIFMFPPWWIFLIAMVGVAELIYLSYIKQNNMITTIDYIEVKIASVLASAIIVSGAMSIPSILLNVKIEMSKIPPEIINTNLYYIGIGVIVIGLIALYMLVNVWLGKKVVNTGGKKK